VRQLALPDYGVERAVGVDQHFGDRTGDDERVGARLRNRERGQQGGRNVDPWLDRDPTRTATDDASGYGPEVRDSACRRSRGCEGKDRIGTFHPLVRVSREGVCGGRLTRPAHQPGEYDEAGQEQ
jgi:hypothetical protein